MEYIHEWLGPNFARIEVFLCLQNILDSRIATSQLPFGPNDHVAWTLARIADELRAWDHWKVHLLRNWAVQEATLVRCQELARSYELDTLQDLIDFVLEITSLQWQAFVEGSNAENVLRWL